MSAPEPATVAGLMELVRGFFGPSTLDEIEAYAARLASQGAAAEPKPNEYGTNTGHGHVWSRPDGVRARCGGPPWCQQCLRDAGRKMLYAAPAVGARPLAGIPRENNDKLCEFARRFKLDGDWLTCTKCKRSLIASRDGEPLGHATGCQQSDQLHPWAELRALIAPTVGIAAPAGGEAQG